MGKNRQISSGDVVEELMLKARHSHSEVAIAIYRTGALFMPIVYGIFDITVALLEEARKEK